MSTRGAPEAACAKLFRSETTRVNRSVDASPAELIRTGLIWLRKAQISRRNSQSIVADRFIGDQLPAILLITSPSVVQTKLHAICQKRCECRLMKTIVRVAHVGASLNFTPKN